MTRQYTVHTEYIVYRHQSMAPAKIVGIWSAATPEGAIDRAAGEVRLRSNQHLTATPVSRASRADYYAAAEIDAVRNGLGN